jgi:class 3 adenylate cyclase
MDGLFPEVSLITSWYDPLVSTGNLEALDLALEECMPLFDLYFLGGSDIRWYQKAAGRPESGGTDPLSFAASLGPEELGAIATALKGRLTQKYQGNLIGLRPRFAALATHWPQISLPSEEDPENGSEFEGRRIKSIKAVRNSLYLAALLGCRHVEIVCGSCIPEHFGPHKRESADVYRQVRMKALSGGLTQVFLTEGDNLLFSNAPGLGIPAERIPYLCIEIEPGASFLMNGISAFDELIQLLKGTGIFASEKTLLNVDIAHMMLLGEPEGRPLKQIRDLHLESRIGHMHISDHSKTHACDLPPGTFHFFDAYEPWLKLALELAQNQKTFSRVIAVEMEACNSIAEALDAVATVRRWLRPIATQQETQGHPRVTSTNPTGSLIVVDIGNSTQELLSGQSSLEAGYLALEDAVKEICLSVQNHGGAVMSFTGDGIIGLFEDSQFTDPARAASAALDAVHEIEMLSVGSQSAGISFRASLHHGSVYIPATGRLRSQIIGPDVVCAARLCQMLAERFEILVHAPSRGTIVGATAQYWNCLPETAKAKSRLQEWGKVNFKGLPDTYVIYVPEQFAKLTTLPGSV